MHGTGFHKDIIIEVYNAFSGALSLPSFSSPIPLAHFTVHFHFRVVCTYMILCIYQNTGPTKEETSYNIDLSET